MRGVRARCARRAAATAVMLGLALPAASAMAQTAATASPSGVAAQGRFDQGRVLFEQGRTGDALTEFRASLELFQSPNTRLYIGLCLQRVGRFADAWEELSRTVVEAGDRIATDRRYESARDVARQALGEVEANVGLLTLRAASVPPGLEVHVGDAALEVPSLGTARAFDPGSYEVVARAPGFVPFRRAMTLVAGGRAEVAVTLEPLAPVVEAQPAPVPVPVPPDAPPVAMRGGGVRVAGFVVGGVGVAALAVFAGLGSAASSQYATLSQVCPRTAAGTADRVRDIDQGAAFTAGANAMLGVGLTALVAGVVMFGVGGARPVTPAVEAFADPSRGVLGVRGAF